MSRLFIPLFSIVLLVSTSLSAQKKDRVEYLPNFDNKQLHFGYYLGLNKKGFKIKYNDENFVVNNFDDDYIAVEESYGFNIGLVVDYRLHDHINLRFEPGLSANKKTLTYNPMVVDPSDAQLSGNVREVSGTYARLPVLLKFSTNRIHNMRAFVIGGVSYDYNFSSNQKNADDNFSGQFRMKSSNFSYEIGVGVDVYLYFFKFSPSIRGVFAINNEIVPDNFNGSPYTGPIDYFGTRGIFLNFTFE
ncbi:MAG: PorT family protein [Flavobacteriaceae bacterium]|nr:PorT family protein [Flavobacteriaceae bacterium]